MVYLQFLHVLFSIPILLTEASPWSDYQSRGSEFRWSEWSQFSLCSRSCGIGVKQRYRVCHRIGSPSTPVNNTYCPGKSQEHHACNKQVCPDGSRDFRRLQCEYFNGISHRQRQHTWRPFITGRVTAKSRRRINPCSLTCSAVGMTGLVVKFSSRVVDGTPCGSNLRDLCVGGQCMKLGCDWQLGTGAKLDKCGVCNGDGRTCDVTSGVVEKVLQPDTAPYRVKTNETGDV